MIKKLFCLKIVFYYYQLWSWHYSITNNSGQRDSQNIMNTKCKNAFHFVESNSKVHGFQKTIISLWFKILKRAIGFNRLIIIVLDKSGLRRKKADDSLNHSFRFAKGEDLVEIQKTDEFEICTQDIEAHEKGEKCLLHFVNDELAGYTWAHPLLSPTIISGIRLKIPNDTIYNYKGFTHPRFRGKGLQSVRYFNLFNKFEDEEKQRLLGYVEFTNWSSQRGQKKGGYVGIGKINFLSFGKFTIVFLSKKIRCNGVDLTTYKYKFKNCYFLNNERPAR